MPPAPERLRPLRYKTALRIAFEKALRKAGFDVPEDVAGPELVTATWKGTRA